MRLISLLPVLFFLFAGCKQKNQLYYIFSTPVIDTNNRFVSVNNFFTNNKQEYLERYRVLEKFGSKNKARFSHWTDSTNGQQHFTFDVRFTCDGKPIDLGMIAKYTFIPGVDSIINPDCFLYGGLFPNGGQATGGIFRCYNQQVLSNSAHLLISWQHNKLKKTEYKRGLNPDFKHTVSLPLKKDKEFYTTSNTSTELVLYRWKMTTSIGAAFNIHLDKRKATISISKNGEQIHNEEILF